MLDERFEYLEYTCFLGDEAAGRLKYSTLRVNLSGLDRATLIIARHFLFEEGALSAENKQSRIDSAKAALRLWLSIEEECADGQTTACLNEEDIKNLNCRLYRYINKKIETEQKKAESLKSECFSVQASGSVEDNGSDTDGTDTEKDNKNGWQKILDEFSNKRAGYENDLYNAEYYKSITIDKQIARALRLGPLKRYYLAAQISPLNKKGEPESGFKLKTKSKKNALDLTLKLTAALLLEERRLRDFGSESIYGPAFRKYNKKDLANWCLLDKVENNQLEWAKYNEKEVFEYFSDENTAFARLNPGYLKDFGWRILEENELDEFLKENPDGIFFSDQGSGKELALNARYS